MLAAGKIGDVAEMFREAADIVMSLPAIGVLENLLDDDGIGRKAGDQRVHVAGYWDDQLAKVAGKWLFTERIIRLWDGEVLARFPGRGKRVPRKRPPELVVKRA